MDLRSRILAGDFLENIVLLQKTAENKDVDAIPELFDLHDHPLNDPPVDNMITDTIRSLLSGNEALTIQGLNHESPKIRLLCARIAGANRFQSSVSHLLKMLGEIEETDDILNLLTVLTEIKPEDYIDKIKPYIHHPDDTIAGIAAETLAETGRAAYRLDFERIINDAEADDKYADCSIVTYKAIEGLGNIKNDESISFLVKKIHHRNPSARQCIHRELVKMGVKIVPHLEPIFHLNDETLENIDKKIMAANVIGFMKDKKGGDLLVQALDRGTANHPNVRYAIYDAFGAIHFMKGLMCLLDALNEKDIIILTAVMSALNTQVFPGVLEKLNGIIRAKDDQSMRIVNAVVISRAFEIVKPLYAEDDLADLMVDAVAKSGDDSLKKSFSEVILQTGKVRSAADVKRFESVAADMAVKRALALDDSKSLLFIYKSALAAIGFDVTTALNGREAYDIVEKGGVFDVVVTDLNMPEMDGIEFTKRFRMIYPKTPVIMVTTESESSQVTLASRIGVSAFMKKPFTPEALQEKVKQMVGV